MMYAEMDRKPPTTAVAQPGLSHIVSLGVLATVFGALVLLTVLTLVVAQFDFGNLNLYVALSIAGIKGTLVVLYFMHLRYDQPFILVVFLGCLAFVVLFISLVLTDTRANFPSETTREAPAMKDVHTPFGTDRP